MSHRCAPMYRISFCRHGEEVMSGMDYCKMAVWRAQEWRDLDRNNSAHIYLGSNYRGEEMRYKSFYGALAPDNPARVGAGDGVQNLP